MTSKQKRTAFKWSILVAFIATSKLFDLSKQIGLATSIIGILFLVFFADFLSKRIWPLSDDERAVIAARKATLDGISREPTTINRWMLYTGWTIASSIAVSCLHLLSPMPWGIKAVIFLLWMLVTVAPVILLARAVWPKSPIEKIMGPN